jgi:hypothetical protein
MIFLVDSLNGFPTKRECYYKSNWQRWPTEIFFQTDTKVIEQRHHKKKVLKRHIQYNSMK